MGLLGCVLLSACLLLLLLRLVRHRLLPSLGRSAPPHKALPPFCVEDLSLQHEPKAASLVREAEPSAARGARFVIVSTWPPTKCGIASYSAGLREGLLEAGAAAVDVVAVHLRSARPTQYGPEARDALSSAVRETCSDALPLSSVRLARL